MRFCMGLFLAAMFLVSFAAAQVPQAGHVVMVVEENHSYGTVIGSSSMPYLNSLARKYGLATAYYANTHPSIGNYFMLTTGQTITNNDAYTGTVTSNNLVRTLLTAGVTWKAYAESLPSAGYVGGDVYPYVKHHNPFAYFSDVRNSSTESSNIVPFSQFTRDLSNGSLPRFSFLIPNLQHDMHDCPSGPTGCTDSQKLTEADNWLKTNLAPLLVNPEFQKDGLLIITWDEGNSTDTAPGGGHVATLMIGPKLKTGYKSTNLYQEPSLLRTALASLGITSNLPGVAANASLMQDFFQRNSTTSATSTTSAATTSTTSSSATTACGPATTIPSITICSPETSTTSPIHLSAAAVSNTSVGYMAVWLDGVKMYQANATNIDTDIPATAGTHRLTVQAKDASGNLFAKTIYTTVAASCPFGTGAPSINLCSPGSSSNSPIAVSASATSTYPVRYMAVWMDGVKMYQVNANTLNTIIAASTGTHRITVQAKDASGYLFAKTIYTTVGSTTTNQTWSISGVISPAMSGAGATVALGGSKTASTTADANGNYVFSGLANGTYTIAPAKSGFTLSPSSAAVSISGANLGAINFTASSTAAPHSVSLKWAASTSAVVGYYVYRSTTSGGPFTKLNSTALGSTSYLDSNVSAGTTYYYTVTAVNSSGAESAYSNQVKAVIPTP